MSSWVPVIISLCSLGVAACSLIMVILNYTRSGRWKDTEDAKEIAKSFQMIRQEQDDQGDRITAVEERTREVATKSDIQSLRREVEGLEKLMAAKVEAVREQTAGMRIDLSEIKKWLMRDPA
jgi:hypothetical protein